MFGEHTSNTSRSGDFNDSSIFTIDLATSVMKPQIPEFVNRGLEALKTEDMKVAIIQCFKTASRLDIAKQDMTYDRAKAALPNTLDIPVPTDIEPEENVGPAVSDHEVEGQVQTANQDGETDPSNIRFDIELRPDTFESFDNSGFDSEHSSDCGSRSSTSDSSTSEEEPQLVALKKARKPNTMLGSVRGGKYSAK